MKLLISHVLLIFLIVVPISVESSPYIVRIEIGTELVIKAYDLELNEIAEYRENITIGPTFEQVRTDAVSIHNNPKLEFLSDSPFNIINSEKIIFENINAQTISSMELQGFLSGTHEVIKINDFTLSKLSLEPRSKQNLIFDGVSDTKFIWLDQEKIWSDVSRGTDSIDQLKIHVNYTMQIFDTSSNIVTNIPINWTNFPARLIIDENDPTEYNFEITWKGSAIRDRFHYQIFYYSQFPKDDQSTAPSVSKIFVMQFDTNSYKFNSFVFDFDNSANPEKYSTVVFSVDGTKIFLGPWIEGRTVTQGETVTKKFSEDIVGITLDLKLNTSNLHTLFTENDNSQIGIRYLALSDTNVVFIKNEKELISYDLSSGTSSVLVADIDKKIGGDAASIFKKSNTNDRATAFLMNTYFIVIQAGTIVDEHEENGGDYVSIPFTMVFLAIISVILVRRKMRRSISP